MSDCPQKKHLSMDTIYLHRVNCLKLFVILFVCACRASLSIELQEHGLPPQKEGHHSKKDNEQCSCHENETRENQKHIICIKKKTNTGLPFHILI